MHGTIRCIVLSTVSNVCYCQVYFTVKCTVLSGVRYCRVNCHVYVTLMSHVMTLQPAVSAASCLPPPFVSLRSLGLSTLWCCPPSSSSVVPRLLAPITVPCMDGLCQAGCS